jgi:hypothetical protein
MVGAVHTGAATLLIGSRNRKQNGKPRPAIMIAALRHPSLTIQATSPGSANSASWANIRRKTTATIDLRQLFLYPAATGSSGSSTGSNNFVAWRRPSTRV